MALVVVPKTEIFGMGDVNRRNGPFTFEGSVETEMQFLGEEGKSLDEISYEVGTLAVQRMLYEIGLRHFQKMGLDKENLSPKALQAGIDFYKQILTTRHRVKSESCTFPVENPTNDFCDYKNVDKSMRMPNDSYIPARWIVRPAFQSRDQMRELRQNPERLEGAKEYKVALPPTGYVVLTNDGFHSPETGLPFATTENIDDAIKTITARIKVPTYVAKFMLSKFYRNDGSEEGTLVCRATHHKYRGGSFDILACADPFTARFYYNFAIRAKQ